MTDRTRLAIEALERFSKLFEDGYAKAEASGNIELAVSMNGFAGLANQALAALREPEPADGIALIAAERKRQVEAEGCNPEHDDEHVSGELAEAAACYAAAALYCAQGWPPRKVTDHLSFPWPEWWKPSPNPIRNLEKAGALVAAEIDRLQRANSVSIDTPAEGDLEC